MTNELKQKEKVVQKREKATKRNFLQNYEFDFTEDESR